MVLEVRLEESCQPDQLDVALTFTLKPIAVADIGKGISGVLRAGRCGKDHS